MRAPPPRVLDRDCLPLLELATTATPCWGSSSLNRRCASTTCMCTARREIPSRAAASPYEKPSSRTIRYADRQRSGSDASVRSRNAASSSSCIAVSGSIHECVLSVSSRMKSSSCLGLRSARRSWSKARRRAMPRTSAGRRARSIGDVLSLRRTSSSRTMSCAMSRAASAPTIFVALRRAMEVISRKRPASVSASSVVRISMECSSSSPMKGAVIACLYLCIRRTKPNGQHRDDDTADDSRFWDRLEANSTRQCHSSVIGRTRRHQRGAEKNRFGAARGRRSSVRESLRLARRLECPVREHQ